MQLRITGLYMLRSLWSLRGCGRLGHYVPTPPSTHIFAGLQTYGLPIRPAKTSYTAGTLCAISAIVQKIY
jgi:hypothetical protein